MWCLGDKLSMGSNSFSNGWVFGPKNDLIVFGGATIFAILLAQILPQFQTGLIVFSFLDEVNVFVTFFYTYTLKYPNPLVGRKLLRTPFIVLFVLLAIWRIWGIKQVSLFVELFALYHFIKQQNAWFFISAEKEKIESSFEKWINILGIYSITWGLTLSSLASPVAYGWWRRSELIPLPVYLYKPLLAVSVGFIAVYCAYNFILFTLGRRLISKNFHFVNALIIWGGDRFIGHKYGFGLLMAAGHTIPYLFLCSLYLKKQMASGRQFKLPKISLPYLYGFIYIFSVLIGILEYCTAESAPSVLLLWGATSLCHFIIDGFFWKRRVNPEGSGILFNLQVVES